jgi:AraC-like DNA-binding protein
VTAEAFFNRDDARALLEQARVAASMPVAVHVHDDRSDGALVAGCGGCTACRLAGSTDAGRAACAESRNGPARQAFHRNRAVPFVCHLGLSCVAAPFSKSSGQRCSVTFGPFCPSEAPDGLAGVVAEGLDEIGLDETPDLSDIARVSADGVPILVDWTVERLNALWDETGADRDATALSESDEPEPAPQPRTMKSRARVPGPAPVIVVALAAGDRDTARSFLRNALDEAAALPEGGAHARAISVVSQVLEAAGQARLPTDRAWVRFEELAAAGRESGDVAKLSRRCMRVMTTLRYTKDNRSSARIAAVFNDVLEGYGDGILLEDAAAKAGADPTAITHLLQRRFNLSFSELVGKVRVERAKQYLRESQFTVGEIARRVGISDISNFGRVFRRFEGVSPAHYRERFRRAA